MSLSFEVRPHPSPRSDAERQAILEAPGFGVHFTDHMAVATWTAADGWHDSAVIPYGPFSLDPATAVLHYAQEIFEGLKAYRQPDGSVASFRPEANAARFQRSAVRLAMPELPVETFIEACDVLVQQDQAWVPAHGGEESLYLRPFMIAAEVGLGVRPANEYLFLVIASPAGAYFPGGVKPVSIWLSQDRVRAVPGGMGDAKTGGNYAASLLAQAEAAAQGCDQVAYLDAVEHKWVEELGGMNVVFVYKDGTIVTPQSPSILEGITRDTVLTLAREEGIPVAEDMITRDQLYLADEVFLTGTAAEVTPVREVDNRKIGDGVVGPITKKLQQRYFDVVKGSDTSHPEWLTRV